MRPSGFGGHNLILSAGGEWITVWEALRDKTPVAVLDRAVAPDTQSFYRKARRPWLDARLAAPQTRPTDRAYEALVSSAPISGEYVGEQPLYRVHTESRQPVDATERQLWLTHESWHDKPHAGKPFIVPTCTLRQGMWLCRPAAAASVARSSDLIGEQVRARLSWTKVYSVWYAGHRDTFRLSIPLGGVACLNGLWCIDSRPREYTDN